MSVRLVRRRALTACALALIAFVFIAKMVNYVDPSLSRPSGLKALYHRVDLKTRGILRNASFLHSCPAGETKIGIPGGWECASGPPTRTPYDRIFRSYPAEPHGREYVYASTANGSKEAGAALLAGVVEIPRYRPVRVGATPSWRENPYHSVYWRFNYYALRPTENLLSAYVQTGDERYARALVRLDLKFFKAEPASPYAWADFHAVSFRAMVLVHEWWLLREYHQLSEAESAAFLREIAKTGRFLADRNHYQPQYNHGVNESAALLEVALDFPGLPGAGQWREVANTRIRQSLADLIDADGELVENSPYYHFYTLDKYWQLLEFTHRLGVTIAPDFRAKLEAMTRFGTYVLRPDSSVPLLGASISAVIHDSGSFAEIARSDPSFRYVLTHGEEGREPGHTSVFFPSSGLTIMRSGWEKGSSFADQSYLTFQVGAYRTAHSQLDGLGITLYGAGGPLLSAPGLYTYAGKHPGPLFRYFHGTSSHNAVVVDGRDQIEGAVRPGPLLERDGVTYQSAESDLYPGVTQRRLVMMLDEHHFLVVDRLSSRSSHSYTQMFHFFPGAQVRLSGTSARAVDPASGRSLTIRQLSPVEGVSLEHAGRKPPQGLCSQRYHRLLGCVAAAYLQQGRSAAFTTLLTIGDGQPDTSGFQAAYNPAMGTVRVLEQGRALTIRLGQARGRPGSVRATDPVLPPQPQGTTIAGTSEPQNWVVAGNGTKTSGGGSLVGLRNAGSPVATLSDDRLHADLSRSNLQLRLKIDHAENVSDLTLDLSNYHWASFTSNKLHNAYPERYDGEWLTISLGRSRLRNDIGGNWTTSGRDFSWSRIDGARISLESSRRARPVHVQLQFLKAIPQQRQGLAAIVFDDGYDSILPAAAYMHGKGMPGNVAVIGKYIDFSSIHHLTKYDLRRLQDRWGWDMANHSQKHLDAVARYAATGDYGGYERDIIAGARVLQRDGLDSAPDWFIYPHGTVDSALERVVGRFYRFARTTDKEPEAYPFGDPLRVKTFEISGGADSEGGSTNPFTPPREVIRAAHDAVRYHTTLIITFHRIHSRLSDPTGYPLMDFEKIVDGLAKARIKVVTLSGLERAMGVRTDNRMVIDPGRPSQITATITEPTEQG